ncbi:MAG: cation:proton antiporter [Deltaproteobacteria bacterium]|nr:cation:proton antiporter [Deltaproteobacteria bacterium]
MKNIFSILFLIGAPLFACASGGLIDPLEHQLPFIITLLLVAKLGGALFAKIHQPAVLGELICGVLLGNLAYLSGDFISFFEPVKDEEFIRTISEMGVIILLFQVGLETKLSSMLKVGLSSFFVACIGVFFPFVFGYLISSWLGYGANSTVHIFIGATLTATSVGITARVLQDLKKLDLDESRIVLGAAVIDDVIGLIILAVVSALASSFLNGGEAHISFFSVLVITAKAVGFLVSAIFLGHYLAPWILNLSKYLRVEGMSLVMALGFAFTLAYISHMIGLHFIVGAFAAGLILEEAHFVGFHYHENLERIITPLSDFFVPFFFLLIGMKVSLSVFTHLSVVTIALVLSAVAVVTKLAAGLGVVGKNIDRLSVGIGMIPRGEVGLIFASIGLGTGVLKQDVYSAIVVMVMLTTFVTPPLLKWSLSRKEVSKP